MSGSIAVVGVTCLCASACVSSRVGPGVFRQDWFEPSRDPNPMRNPTQEQTANPWAETTPTGASEPTAADEARLEVSRAVAVAAAVLAGGWLPVLSWYGTFEENRLQRR